jgi:2-polyprenyl-3-methyl-5-hydroxy-6-metoxy-1,4-benzoquinol methylase/uncharacterized protein YbaR (Trm112 family)
MSVTSQKILETVRCPRCHGPVHFAERSENGDGEGKALECSVCDERFPLTKGIPRLLLSPLREALLGQGDVSKDDARQVETALSFGYEWSRFPQMYEEWNQTFLNYMQPHGPEFFGGKRVLDAGCGSGRFSYYAAKYGAEVWSIDLGPAVEVAHRNTESAGQVQVIQADLYDPPFAEESFDFIYSIGVLHHLPQPEAAFQNLVRFLKPGGEIQVYLYWKPERQPVKRTLLALVSAARQVTTRLPHSVVHALAFPAAVAAFGLFVWPYKVLKGVPGLNGFAEKLPMKQYAGYPFRVCVNDQLDRLSAPIENRYTRKEVESWLTRAGLEDCRVYSNFGWVGTGRKPRKTVK